MTRRRGLNLPDIPPTEFVPKPPGINARYGLWGMTIRTRGGETYYTDAMELDSLEINGTPLRWHGEGDGTGVFYGRAVSMFGMPVAVARAVPLS